MKIKLIFTVTLIVFGFGIQAQETKKWSLEDCLRYALENNISIKQATLDVEKTEIDKLNAFGTFLPSINGQTTYFRNTGLSPDPVTGLNEIATTQNTAFSLSSSVLIFNGLKNINTHRMAVLGKLASEYQLESMKDNTLLSVVNAYLQVIFSNETLKTNRAQLALTQEEYDRIVKLVKAGSIPESDRYEIEATLASQEQQIVDTENTQIASKLALANLLLVDNTTFEVKDTSYKVPETKIFEESQDAIFKKALTFLPSMKQSNLNLSIAEKNLKIAKADRLPTLTASYRYSSNYFISDIVDEDSQKNFDIQFSNNASHNYGVTLSIPVFNNFTTVSKIKKRHVDLLKRELSVDQKKNEIKDNVYRAFNNALGANKKYEAAIKTFKARERVYKDSRKKLELGLINTFEFNQAKTRFVSSEVEQVKAKYDLIFKLKVLEYYFGVPIGGEL